MQKLINICYEFCFYESFAVDNVKTINGTYSPTIMDKNFSNYGQEVSISVSATPESTKLLDYILQN